jgi:primosomal protein N'
MEALIETRNEYVEHIQDILGIAISKRINKMWEESGSNIKKFQSELTQIKKWNNNIINEEYKKIVKYTKCKYLYNLIKIIIINTIKIKIYEYRNQFDNIKIKIPAAEDYIHKCYMNIASFSWKNAYLFVNKGIKDVEYQNNLNIIEENIKIIIKKTFRDFIPYDEILEQIDESLTDTVSQFNDESDTKNTSPTKSKEIEPEIEEESEGEAKKKQEEGEKAKKKQEKAKKAKKKQEKAKKAKKKQEKAKKKAKKKQKKAKKKQKKAKKKQKKAKKKAQEKAKKKAQEKAKKKAQEKAKKIKKIKNIEY